MLVAGLFGHPIFIPKSAAVTKSNTLQLPTEITAKLDYEGPRSFLH